MSTPFERAVLAAIELLRDLPEGRRAQAERTEALRREHPTVEVALVTDSSGPPGRVEHDLLLTDPELGTLALSLVAAPKSPWAAQHAEHWAAHRVVTVGDRSLSVQDALQLMQTRAAEAPSFLDELLDQVLLSAALEAHPFEAGLTETQVRADAIRRRLGLHDRDRTLRWLEEHGLSAAGLEGLARRELALEAWSKALFLAEGQAYFDAHPEELEQVAWCVVRGDRAVLERLAASPGSLSQAAEALLLHDPAIELEVHLERRSAWELPSSVRTTPVGARVGPQRLQGRWWLAEVGARTIPQVMTPALEAAVRRRLVGRWLEQARLSANIRWHWLGG